MFSSFRSISNSFVKFLNFLLIFCPNVIIIPKKPISNPSARTTKWHMNTNENACINSWTANPIGVFISNGNLLNVQKKKQLLNFIQSTNVLYSLHIIVCEKCITSQIGCEIQIVWQQHNRNIGHWNDGSCEKYMRNSRPLLNYSIRFFIQIFRNRISIWFCKDHSSDTFHFHLKFFEQINAINWIFITYADQWTLQNGREAEKCQRLATY